MKGKKTGGRQKGTPNKASAFMKGVFQDIVQNYILSETPEKSEFGKNFVTDLGKLDPKDRIDVMIKFAQFVVPKPQSIAFEDNTGEKDTLTDKLAKLAQENDK